LNYSRPPERRDETGGLVRRSLAGFDPKCILIMKKNKLRKLELLAPAGSPEKMKYAFHYGADAVYAGIPDFSLRARINAFDLKSIKKGVEYAHKLGKKFYVTLNIYAHNEHLGKLEKHLKYLSKIDIDGIILSDPGILSLVKKYLPKAEIHLSTQANATNWRAVKFWREQGIRRVVLAREVTLDEIREIHKKVPEAELEYFVHGAMCMSYSGRCILSKWMTGRSANLGDCSQPCRWSYAPKSQIANRKSQTNQKAELKKIKTLEIVDRQGEFELDLEEDDQGTYFFNSKDLNLLEYLKDLIGAGVTSFKIEGRNKSVYYLATVVRAYARIMNHELRIKNGIENKKFEEALIEEQNNLDNLVHRGYTAGFLLGREPEHNFKNSHNESEYEFVGEILEEGDNDVKVYPVKSPPSRSSAKQKFNRVKAHNAIYKDDEIEIIDKKGDYPVKILEMYDERMEKVESAHGGHKKIYYFKFDKKNIEPMSLLKKKII
jgi:putative protease